MVIIALYVDDLLLASIDIYLLENSKKALQRKFKMGDQKEAGYCLGVTIKHGRGKKILSINQRSYLENMLKRFGRANCKPVTKLLEQGKKYQKLPIGLQPVKLKEYQAVIGRLRHAAIAARPDLSVVGGVPSQFMSNPSSEH